MKTSWKTKSMCCLKNGWQLGSNPHGKKKTLVRNFTAREMIWSLANNVAMHCSQVYVWKGIMCNEITQVYLDYGVAEEDVMEDLCCLKNESHLCSNRHGKIEDILKEEGTSCQILDDITIQFDTCERITNLVIQCILPAHENFTPKKFKHQNKYCLIFARKTNT